MCTACLWRVHRQPQVLLWLGHLLWELKGVRMRGHVRHLCRHLVASSSKLLRLHHTIAGILLVSLLYLMLLHLQLFDLLSYSKLLHCRTPCQYVCSVDA